MHALIIVNDLTPSDIMKLSKKAAGHYKKVSLLYVKPNMPTCYFRLPSMATIEAHTRQEAVAALSYVGQRLHISKENQWCSTGPVKAQAKYLSKRLGADVILVTEKIYNQFSIKQFRLRHLTCVVRLIQDAAIDLVKPKAKVSPYTLVGHAFA